METLDIGDGEALWLDNHSSPYMHYIKFKFSPS